MIVEIAEWQSLEVKEVTITQGVGSTSYDIQVREFIPQPGDALAREWSSGGVPQSYQCAPYAIADMHRTAHQLEHFVNDNVVNSIEYYTDETDQLIRDTYVMARRYSRIAPVSHGLLSNQLADIPLGRTRPTTASRRTSFMERSSYGVEI